MPYKEFCVFFLGKLFYKSNRKRFSCVCIAWYKHSRRSENSRRLSKPLTSSRVCIIVSNSPNPSRVYIRLCKHGKRFLLLKRIFTIFESLIIYSVCSQSLHKFLFSKALQEIFSPPNSLYRKGANSVLWGTQIIASSVSILSYFYRTKNFFSNREQIIII